MAKKNISYQTLANADAITQTKKGTIQVIKILQKKYVNGSIVTTTKQSFYKPTYKVMEKVNKSGVQFREISQRGTPTQRAIGHVKSAASNIKNKYTNHRNRKYYDNNKKQEIVSDVHLKAPSTKIDDGAVKSFPVNFKKKYS